MPLPLALLAPVVLRAVFSSAAARTLGALVSRKVTWGGMAAMSALPVGIAAVEYKSDGALSQKTAEAAIETVKAGIRTGAINHENVESQIDNVGTVMGITNVLNKTVQNQIVQGVISGHTDPTSAKALNAGKNAAMGWLLMPGNVSAIVGKNGIRSQLIDGLFPDRNKGDRYLAEKFIDDIVTGAQVNALGDNRVSRTDVKTVLQKELSKPDSAIAEHLRDSRIGKGLNQIWPDLYKPSDVPAEPSGKTLREKFTSVISNVAPGHSDKGAEKDTDQEQDKKGPFAGLSGISGFGPIGGIIMFIFNLLKGLFGGKGNVTAQTDNPERLAALRERNGGDMPSIITHDGSPAPVAPTPLKPRQLAPGL